MSTDYPLATQTGSKSAVTDAGVLLLAKGCMCMTSLDVSDTAYS